MSIPLLTFFNNKSGVGKTSLIYYLAWMFEHLGKKVLIADIDPQANLTAAFLPDDKIDEIWNTVPGRNDGHTIFQCVKPLAQVGDILPARLQMLSEKRDGQPITRRATKTAKGRAAPGRRLWKRTLDKTPRAFYPMFGSFWLSRRDNQKLQALCWVKGAGPCAKGV